MIFVSPDTDRRLERAEQFLAGLSQGQEATVVGATRRAADELIHRLAADRGAVFGLHSWSLERLAWAQASTELAREGLTPASPSVLEATAARVIASGPLGRFEPLRESLHFPAALARTLNELRLARVDRVEGELGRLLTLYAQELEVMRVADRRRLFEAATRRVAPVWPLVLVDVAIQWPCEADLVAWLVSQAREALVVVPSGDQRTLAFLKGEAVVDQPPDGRALTCLKFELFGRQTRSPEGQDEVSFFSAPGEGREAVEVARRIVAEARAGMAFDSMAVVVRSNLYGPYLETAFRRAGIPAYFDRGTRQPDPSGRAFATLLRCALEGLSARRFAEYLSLDQAPQVGQEGSPPERLDTWAPPPDEESVGPEPNPARAATIAVPRGWEALLVEASVLRGGGRWRRRLEGLRAECGVKASQLEPDSPRRAGLELKQKQLEDLSCFALSLIEELEQLPQKPADWGVWLAKLRRLAGRALYQPEPVLAHLTELEPLVGQGLEVGLGTVIEVLEGRLLSLHRPPPSRRYGQVFVGSPQSLRGRSFGVVFVIGLAEGMFPVRLQQDPLLGDDLRSRLSKDLPTRVHQGQQERLHLRLALGAARRRLHISYPRVESSQGKQRVPSFYALEILRVSQGRFPELSQLEQDAIRASRTRLDWPAPPQPADALEAFEHDLAVLRELLHRPDQVAGGARYLMEANPYLARSLRRRWRRWSPAWSQEDGLLDPSPEVLALLKECSLTSKPYSATALQRFSVCPYQFYLASVQRLKPRETFEHPEQMPPLVRGTIVHEVQARLMLEEKAPSEAALHRTLERVAAHYEDLLAPPLLAVWNEEIERLRVDLLVWLKQIKDEQDTWQPRAFEWSFGLELGGPTDSASLGQPALLDDRYLLHGCVDWLDEHRQTGRWRVTDHKTGRALSRLGMVNGGAVLQPLLYALAAEVGLKISVAEARLFYCSSKGRFQARSVEVGPRQREVAIQVLEAVEQSFELGFFPAYPGKGACRYCDFQPVCGPGEERRVEKKFFGESRLEALHRVRDLP